MTPTEAGWQQAVSGELEGGVVPDEVFETLLTAVSVKDHSLPVNPEWLQILLPVLTEVQAIRLYKETRLLERLYSSAQESAQ